MNKLPVAFKRFITHLVYFLGIPLFLLLSILIYDPFGLRGVLDMGRDLFSLNASILFSIVLCTLVLTRCLFYILRNVMEMKWLHYILWCAGEVILAAGFSALFLTLMQRSGEGYFPVFASCLIWLFSILIYPYSIITLSFALAGARNDAPDGDHLIRFYDEYKKPKLIIAGSAVLFIMAEENYVKIHYLDAGASRTYQLRASMRSIDDTVTRHGLVRCHRSYYLNPAHIKLLRREPGGMVKAELDVAGIPSVPVSKRYYETVSGIL